jgi:prepilin-type N-terminal cleavage/methylation domain-containing protein/prepilin-type processing-associated H-X9-DG protein
MKPLSSRRPRLAFTLVELLVVIGIISLLLTLSLPAYSAMMLKAQSVKCSVNLRTIGVAVMQAASDNNNTYPEIDQAAATIYPPAGSVPGLVGVLGPYGVTTNTTECPVDVGNGATSSFKTYGSSYEWNPAYDDESVNATLLYISPTTPIPVNSARVRLVSDFVGIHRGRQNVLYGDGHVTVH